MVHPGLVFSTKQRCLNARLLFSRGLKHGQRFGAFDGDPRGTTGEQEHQALADEFPAAQDGAVEIDVAAAAVAGGEETGELGVAVPAARITTEPETEGRTMTQVEQEAGHSDVIGNLEWFLQWNSR